jgi:hypothetical protein
VEDRISEIKDKIEIKENNRRNLSQTTQKLWKECARSQWLNQKTKPDNHGHWEGKKVQAKGIHNIFNEITDYFPNLETVSTIQVQEASRTPNILNQNRTAPWHIIIKKQTQKTEEEYWSL